MGLSIGLASVILLSIYVINERSYDSHFSKKDRIHRVSREFFSKDGSTSLHLGHLAPGFGPLFKNDFGEIVEKVARMRRGWGATFKYDNNIFYASDFFYSDPEMLDIFDFDFVKGDPKTALIEPKSLIISTETAEKIFGDKDPMGKVINVDINNQFKVTGVFKPLPENTHFQIHSLADMSQLVEEFGGNDEMMKAWGRNNYSTFVLLKEGHKIEEMSSQFESFLDRHLFENPNSWTALHTMPLTDIHLKSQLDSEIQANGDEAIVYTFASVALLILILACLNYINLALSRAGDRAKEIGVKKSIGASKRDIAIQFNFESALITFISAILGLLIAEFSAPWIKENIGISLNFSLLNHSLELVLYLLFSIVLGLIAGVYPSYVLNSFKTSSVLKGDYRVSDGGKRFKEGLLIAQFAIAVFLLFCTSVIIKQLDFINNKDLGYDKENVAVVYANQEIEEKYDLVKQRIESIPGVMKVSGSNMLPGDRLMSSGGAQIEFGDTMISPEVTIKAVDVDYGFFETFNLPMIAGRDFSESFATDDTTAFIINEAASNMIGFERSEDAIDKKFHYWGREGRIVGVVKDFHFEALHHNIAPIVFRINKENAYQIAVKFAGEKPSEVVAQLENIWTELAPNMPFESNFLDEEYAQLYESEQARGDLFTLFSSLAFFIAGLGLLGLTVYYLSQKLKEISIRKILGASIGHLFMLLSKRFMILILVSLVPGTALAWYFSNMWLEGFAYRIEIDFYIIIVTVLLTVVLSSLPLIWTTIKANNVNPIKWLRDQ